MSNTSSFIKPVDNFLNQNLFTQISEIRNEGFNSLFRAKRYGKWWLIKALKKELQDDIMYQSFLQKEYDILVNLHHPYIVQVHSFEYINGIGKAIVMEWIEGISLSEWLTKTHSKGERRNIIRRIIDALKYIESVHTQHRDIKPSNIMVTNNGEHIKLIDFGLGDTDSYAILKQAVGSSGYMAPDGPSDIYSFGKLLETLNTGFFTKFVIKRCCVDKDKRFNSFTSVKRWLNFAWQLPEYIFISIFIIIISITFYIATIKSAYNQISPEIDSIEQTITQDKEELLKRKQTYNNIITNMCNDIDNIVIDSDIENKIDTMSNPIYINDTKILIYSYFNNKLKNLPNDITIEEKQTIMIEVSTYIQEKYILRWIETITDKVLRENGIN